VSDLAGARQRFVDAVDAFRRVSLEAVDAAANPRADEMTRTEARHRATFALAAASLAFKAAVQAADAAAGRGRDPD
jgi:hypothetical protein